MTAATNEVTFKYACASGKVDGPLTLTTINGTENSFDTTGTYRDEIGPVPSGGYPTYTARYQGYVTPTGSLRFTVSYTDSGGNSVEKTFDGFLDADPSFTEVCALSSPVPSVSASPSPQIQTSN